MEQIIQLDEAFVLAADLKEELIKYRNQQLNVEDPDMQKATLVRIKSLLAGLNNIFPARRSVAMNAKTGGL